MKLCRLSSRCNTVHMQRNLQIMHMLLIEFWDKKRNEAVRGIEEIKGQFELFWLSQKIDVTYCQKFHSAQSLGCVWFVASASICEYGIDFFYKKHGSFTQGSFQKFFCLVIFIGATALSMCATSRPVCAIHPHVIMCVITYVRRLCSCKQHPCLAYPCRLVQLGSTLGHGLLLLA